MFCSKPGMCTKTVALSPNQFVVWYILGTSYRYLWFKFLN